MRQALVYCGQIFGHGWGSAPIQTRCFVHSGLRRILSAVIRVGLRTLDLARARPVRHRICPARGQAHDVAAVHGEKGQPRWRADARAASNYLARRRSPVRVGPNCLAPDRFADDELGVEHHTAVPVGPWEIMVSSSRAMIELISSMGRRTVVQRGIGVPPDGGVVEADHRDVPGTRRPARRNARSTPTVIRSEVAKMASTSGLRSSRRAVACSPEA